MPISTLSFVGINRAITDYSTTSACEEIINMRPSSNGLVPVKPFKTMIGNSTYKKIFVHETADGTHYIAPRVAYDSTDEDYYLYIDHLTEGESQMLITSYKAAAVPSDLDFEHLHYAATGNIFLISIDDRTPRTGLRWPDGCYLNIAYIWKGGVYAVMESNIPVIATTLTPTIVTKYTEVETGNESASQTAETIQSQFNKFQEDDPKLCAGPIIIAIAFKTKDGNTFWTGKWSVYDPIPAIKAITGQYSHYYTSLANVPQWLYELYPDFFTRYFTSNSEAYYLADVGSWGVDMWLQGATLSMQINQVTGWDESTSVLDSVEVYASKPILYIDPSILTEDTAYDYMASYRRVIIPPIKYREMDFESQLLYLQESIPLKELAKGAYTFDLYFGGSSQVVEDTLDVDAGMTRRYGKILAFNARFHYYESIARTTLDSPKFYYTGALTVQSSMHVFVEYNDGETSKLIYRGTEKGPTNIDALADIVIAPSINIKRVITEYQSGYNNWYIATYTMYPSTSYNYAISHGTGKMKVALSEPSDLSAARTAGAPIYLHTEETAAINVTEQYNPFVSMVEHSYLAPGTVLDIRPQVHNSVDDAYGDYPLNVFTDRGVYALLQGSANVLYGAFKPLSDLIAVGNGVSTDTGTFFLSSGNLWIIAGRRTTLVSDALTMGPHKYIRTCDGFIKLSMGNGSSAQITGTYDVTNLQSQVEFRDYVYKKTNSTISKASLSYNRYRDELYISNPDYAYYYCLSLKYRQWFKIAGTIWQDVSGSELAVTPGSSTGTLTFLRVTDETDDTDVLVHLQSRPFSFGYQYAHIHRAIAMIRARLTNANSVIVGLYGSDNLQDWNLLSFSQRAGVSAQSPTKVSQIRTPSSARSWRYYTVCIGGTAHTDTDLGPVLVDYEQVVRRLG